MSPFSDLLVGLAAGDMLGAPMEFCTPTQVQRLYGEVNGPVPKSHGAFAAGEFTDDTEMALCQLAAYPVDEGLVERATWAFADWLRSGPKDVGNLTRAALAATGVEAWRRSGRESCGNGALMRAASSVAAGSRGTALIDEALQLGAITHADPRSLVACAVYTWGLRALVDGAAYADAWRGAVEAVSRHDIAGSVGYFASGYAAEVSERLAAAHATVSGAVARGLGGEYAGNSGYVVTTLQSAIAAGAASSFAAGLLPIVRLGEDSDTVGAVTGAVLAAQRLLPPPEWLALLRGSSRFASWPKDVRGPEAVQAMAQATLRAAGAPAEATYSEPIPRFVVRRFHPQILYGRNPLVAAEVESLARAGVTALVDLREEWEYSASGRLGGEAVAACAVCGVERLHLPTEDGGAPTSATLDAAVDFLERVLAEGRIAFVHCRAGIERTGALLLAWSVSHQSDLTELQALAPAVEPLPGQVRAVYEWLQTRVNRLSPPA